MHDTLIHDCLSTFLASVGMRWRLVSLNLLLNHTVKERKTFKMVLLF